MIYSVTFSKTENVLGKRQAVGSTFRAVSRKGWPTEDAARSRAWRIFKRDNPDENPMEWAISLTRMEGESR